MEFSLQLWSIKDETEKDFKGALKMVGEHGYNGVEFAGFGDLSAKEMKAELNRNGMYSVGSHTSCDLFKSALRENLAYNQEIGSKYMIIPCCGFDTEEDVHALTKLLNEASAVAKEYGIKVGYHNHAHEFEKFGDKYILDMIAEETNDDVVLEVDVFWVSYAGLDPYEYLDKWGKRVELVHMKQIATDKENVMLPDGIIDFKKVVETAKYAKYFVVEQEGSVDKVAASKINAEYLKNL